MIFLRVFADVVRHKAQGELTQSIQVRLAKKIGSRRFGPVGKINFAFAQAGEEFRGRKVH